jgi:hypothetical protein
MNKKSHNIIYKEVFSEKSHFLSLIKDCVHENWVNKLNENNLKKIERSFITAESENKAVDVVYEDEISGERIILYTFIVLNNKANNDMLCRLLFCQEEFYKYYHDISDADERKSAAFRFPAIIPIVFFTGSTEVTAPAHFRDVFMNSEKFGDGVLDFTYILLETKTLARDGFQTISSDLTRILFSLENPKSEEEFHVNINNNLDKIKEFNDKDKQILRSYVEAADAEYGYSVKDKIKNILQ